MRRLAALLTATLFAVNFTFWSQSLIAEVYTLHALLIVLIFLVAGQLLHTRQSNHALTPSPPHPLILLAFLVGLSLTHHATTLLLLPSLALVLWQVRQSWRREVRVWLWAVLALVAPLALYLYIPLRGGAAASPWYHQPLGTEPLTLYQNTVASFLAFITGQSIAVGFHDLGGALYQLPQAWLLWRLHFLWPGVVLAALGLYTLTRQRNWSLLALTLPLFLLQQIFNLFYAIGDILVYYIPLYLVAAIWAGFAADTIGGGMQTLMREDPLVDQPGAKLDNGTATAQAKPPLVLQVGMGIVLVLFWLPIQLATRDFARLDQSNATAVQERWQAIGAAQLPSDAILVSNDRNEIVPLFYLQVVEGQFNGVTGLFPLIAPDARFADIGATVETALRTSNGRPVYLIKPMPGLAVKFNLGEATPPLVQVTEPIMTTPATTLEHPFGPLRLLGYDWQLSAADVQVSLYWQVQERLAADYTTTVQLFADNGEKVAQNDAPPGGVYYPTSLWKPGEVLVERHTLALEGKQSPATLLVGMYLAADLAPIAPALEISVQDGK